jgi:hypothetical protein
MQMGPHGAISLHTHTHTHTHTHAGGLQISGASLDLFVSLSRELDYEGARVPSSTASPGTCAHLRASSHTLNLLIS